MVSRDFMRGNWWFADRSCSRQRARAQTNARVLAPTTVNFHTSSPFVNQTGVHDSTRATKTIIMKREQQRDLKQQVANAAQTLGSKIGRMTAFVNDVEATTNGAAVTVKANVHRALKVSPDGQHSTDGFGKVMGSCSFALRCGQRIVKLSGNKGGVEHQTVPNSYMIRRETYTAIDVPSGAYEVIVVANSGALRNTMIDTNVQVAVHRPLGPVSAIVRIGDASHLFEEGDSVDEVTLPLTYANDCKLQLLGSDNKVLQSAQAQRLKVARVEVELRKAGTGGDVEQHSVAQPLQSFGVDLLMHVDDESQQQLLALPPLSAPFDGGADAQQPTPPPIAGSHQQPPPPTSARSAQQSTSALFGGGADAHQPHGAGAEQLFDFDRLFAPTSVPLFDFDWPVEQHLVPQGADGAPVDGSRSPLAQAPSVMQVDSDVQQQAAPGGGAVCSLPPPPTSACALDSLAGDAPRSAQQSTSVLFGGGADAHQPHGAGAEQFAPTSVPLFDFDWPVEQHLVPQGADGAPVDGSRSPLAQAPSVMQVDSDVQQQAAPGGGAVCSLPPPPTSACALDSLAGDAPRSAQQSTSALPPSVMQVDSDVQQQAAPGGGAVGSLPVPPTSQHGGAWRRRLATRRCRSARSLAAAPPLLHRAPLLQWCRSSVAASLPLPLSHAKVTVLAPMPSCSSTRNRSLRRWRTWRVIASTATSGCSCLSK
jgi:hypothetical protein